MKAQSDLAGDRKRRAEMTRPRVSGVTKRIDGIETMKASVGTLTAAIANVGGKLEGLTLEPYTSAISTTFNPEKVIYRPAGR